MSIRNFNFEGVLKRASTVRVLTLAVFYKACSYNLLVSSVSKALQSQSFLGSGLRPVIRATAFRLFCGGETIEECTVSVLNMKKAFNVKAIIDHSTEEKLTAEAWDENLAEKMEAIREGSAKMGDSMYHIPLKCTSLICPLLLERIVSMSKSTELDIEQVFEKLSRDDQILYTNGVKRITALCSQAAISNVSILLDAEQSHRQPAIELIARGLMKQFNKGERPVVYNTYQMYLKRSMEALQRDLQLAVKGDYNFAVKLVRGAYVTAERTQARLTGSADPVLPSKQSTDSAYDEAAELLLRHISTSSRSLSSVGSPSSSFPSSSQSRTAAGVTLLLATHNGLSIQRTIRLMDELNIIPSDPRVQFAQIFGMADHWTYQLGLSGYNSFKLVPFGKFDELLPWLLRRLDENQDALGAMQQDREIYVAELKRRFVPLVR